LPRIRSIAPKRAGIAHWLRTLGPGLVVGAADDDPSGIATYSISGATAGYSMLWTALVTLPIMAVLMGMCARIGLVTGEGLVASMKRSFSKASVAATVGLVVSANMLNIAADYAGMGGALRQSSSGFALRFWRTSSLPSSCIRHGCIFSSQPSFRGFNGTSGGSLRF